MEYVDCLVDGKQHLKTDCIEGEISTDGDEFGGSYYMCKKHFRELQEDSSNDQVI
jgi:hypothetical protein